ncbi:MAG: c-type cytochrome [Nitrospirota bacterium]|nr:c-type cytochrome [Nitrospirota bacterium]
MKDWRLFVLFSSSCFCIAGLGAQLTSAASGDPAKGNTIYETNCLVCHGQRGKGDGPIGAALTLPPTDMTGPQVRTKPDKDLLTEIRDGRAAMPPWKTGSMSRAFSTCYPIYGASASNAGMRALIFITAVMAPVIWPSSLTSTSQP